MLTKNFFCNIAFFPGKLELYLDMFDSALSSLSQAKHVLNICYGEKHPTSLQLDQLTFQTIQEKQILSIV